MLCPKCKKNDLQTKRTLANGPTVRRERYCPKCKKSVWTVEIFEVTLTTEREAHKTEIAKLETQKTMKALELDRVNEGLRIFKTLVDKACTEYVEEVTQLRDGHVPKGSSPKAL